MERALPPSNPFSLKYLHMYHVIFNSSTLQPLLLLSPLPFSFYLSLLSSSFPRSHPVPFISSTSTISFSVCLLSFISFSLLSQYQLTLLIASQLLLSLPSLSSPPLPSLPHPFPQCLSLSFPPPFPFLSHLSPSPFFPFVPALSLLFLPSNSISLSCPFRNRILNILV